ncbi:ABC-type transport system, involved in lipoprotein release, permease component [Chitinophaga jiangningensis]|uniref:ABC-type transport system, involved in lipoprotein release, permease component n=1 Tax=Chitinophaga jiangningensis TaxID=1419482 RepID=A0A1M6XV86_9BACT|nr:FtsX-like permease family protein [Chitinophaga jiangningensis]SHL09725.1 ABC-type transport system, involved in lipoprotein release, permease component [Chitinophaga jiangningensis]
MWIVKLAWKNLWRNPTRTLVTVAAIFFAVILSMVAEALKLGVFENLVKNVVSFHSGYIQVHKMGYQDEQILDNSFSQDNTTASLIANTRNVNAVTPRLEAFSLAASAELTKGCLVAGINPELENNITQLKTKLVAGKYLKGSDNAVLMAEGLANSLKLRVYDTVMLIGQGYHGATAAGKFVIKGIVKFGSPQLNNGILFMPLPAAQEYFSAEKQITAYILSVHTDKLLPTTAVAVKRVVGVDYEVLTWEELMPDIKQHIATDSNNMKIVQAVLYLLICFGIFSTLLMMMLERKFEIGMLVAIGMKKSKLILLFIIESVLTVLTGCLAGMVAGVPLIFYLHYYPIRMGGDTAKAYERFGFEAIFPTSTDSTIFISQALTVLMIGIALSLYPIVKILQLKPLTAMKK